MQMKFCLLTAPAFWFRPRRCGCSWGASSVSKPIENWCKRITCAMAESADSRLRRASADSGDGRWGRGSSRWNLKLREALERELVERTYTSRALAFKLTRGNYGIIALVGPLASLRFMISSLLLFSASAVIMPPTSFCVLPRSIIFIPSFSPASSIVHSASMWFFFPLYSSFWKDGGTSVSSSRRAWRLANVSDGSRERP